MWFSDIYRPTRAGLKVKRFFLVLSVGLLSVLSGCATKYIEILEPDIVMYGGEVDYRVQPGDTLKVMSTKICISGRGTCFEVKDMKTGKTGYVSEKRMLERHRIYTEEKQKEK